MPAFPASRWQTALQATKLSTASYAGLKLGKASLIVPRVYLSDYFTAKDNAELVKLGITHIVSILDDEPDLPESILPSNRLHITLSDRGECDILTHLDGTTEFIKAALAENAENKVLVHCYQGVSRSATVVCAYLIATAGMHAEDSVAFVKSKRGIVSPNLGFRKQLEAYGTRLWGEGGYRAEERNAISRQVNKISEGIAGRLRQFKHRKGVGSDTKHLASQ